MLRLNLLRPTLFVILLGFLLPALADAQSIRAGIIGLDTSHAVAFTKVLNSKEAKSPEYMGVTVVAAYPNGSPDIESSVVRVPEYTKAVQELGVEIVPSIEALLEKVDVVFLETNDGRPHLEQLRPCLAAGKPTFIDKPVSGSLQDALLIYAEADQAKVPVFSSSALRFGKNSQLVRQGSIGTVKTALTHSPAKIETSHPDLFWYGIHGVESLFTVMGTGCVSVKRSENADGKIVVTGAWENGRTGVFQESDEANRKGYGGEAVGENGQTAQVGSFDGYEPLLASIIHFFRTGVAPVTVEETLEIYAFMEAADESKRNGGSEVKLSDVVAKAKQALDGQ